MDPKLIYWTTALVNICGVVSCALLGWREIRRGRMETHRRWMTTAAVLVVLFLVSYVFKVIFLGKEQLELWSPTAVTILRIHETFVLTMVLAGGMAMFLGRRLARRLQPGGGPVSPTLRRRHRWSGRTAVVCSIFGLLTAAMVLIGMYGRA